MYSDCGGDASGQSGSCRVTLWEVQRHSSGEDEAQPIPTHCYTVNHSQGQHQIYDERKENRQNGSERGAVQSKRTSCNADKVRLRNTNIVSLYLAAAIVACASPELVLLSAAHRFRAAAA